MAMHKLVLDRGVHRSVRLNNNISDDARFEIKIISGATGNSMEIKFPGLASQAFLCDKIFTPPAIGVKIAGLDPNCAGNQITDLDDTAHRCFELGTELSSTPSISLVIIFATDPRPNHYLLITQSSGQEKVILKDTKIPPQTG